MATNHNKYKDEDEGMNLDYKPSTLYPHNTGQVIDIDDEMETTEKLL